MLANLLKPGMKGAFYGRHSTDKQEMLMQKNSVKNFVSKYQCEIVQEFMDPAVSATKTPMVKREKLQDLLSSVEKASFDFVAIYKNDRLAREPIEHQIIRTTMNQYNIPVIETSSGTLYTESTNIIVQLLQDGLTKLEADNIRERTTDGLEVRVNQGHWTGGQPPYGYTYDKSTQNFVSYPEELDIVKEIYELYKTGEGFPSIANHLSRKYANQKKWSKEKVKRIVTNPFYAGFVTWGKFNSKAKGSLTDKESWIMAKSDLIDPIISEEEWEYCWKLYQQKKQRKVAPKQYKTSFLLKDLVSCKKCRVLLECKDQTTKGNNGKKYGSKIYFCNNCDLKIKTNQLHSVIDKILNDIRLTNPDQIYTGLTESIEKDIQNLHNEIKALEQGKVTYLQKAEKVKQEIVKRLQHHITEHNKKFLDILTSYRISQLNRIEQVNLQIADKEKQIENLQKVESSKGRWNYVLNVAFTDRENLNTVELRNLLCNLISVVFVDHNLAIEYQLRHNLEKRGATNQLELQF